MTPLGRRRALVGTAALALGAAAGSALSSAGCAARADSPEAALWYAYGGKNREVLLELVGRFHATHPGHRVIPTYQGDYFELLAKLRTAMHAGVVPAVTHVVGEVIPYLDEARVLAPLADLGLDDADVVDALAQRGTFRGGGDRPLVGLPFNRSTPIAYCNGEVLDELGLPPPTTWDELRAFARAATRGAGSARRFGFGCPVDWWFWVALVAQAGGSVVEESGEVSLGGEAGVRGLALWQSMVEEGVMRPPPGRDYNAWQVVNADFLGGRVAMIWTSTAFLRYLEQNARFPVIAAPLPADVQRGVPTGGTFFVVPRRAPERQLPAATAFLRFMMEPAQANHFATSTGYIPVSKRGIAALEASGVLARQPNDRVALDQLAHAVPWPWSPRLFRLQRDVVQPRLEGAVLGKRPAAEALAGARAAALLED